MKAKIRAIDLIEKTQVEVEVSIHKDGDPARELNRLVYNSTIRQKIIKGLKLFCGEAFVELISYDRVIAEGIMRNSVFGGGNITTKNCSRAA